MSADVAGSLETQKVRERFRMQGAAGGPARSTSESRSSVSQEHAVWRLSVWSRVTGPGSDPPREATDEQQGTL